MPFTGMPLAGVTPTAAALGGLRLPGQPAPNCVLLVSNLNEEVSLQLAFLRHSVLASLSSVMQITSLSWFCILVTQMYVHVNFFRYLTLLQVVYLDWWSPFPSSRVHYKDSENIGRFPGVDRCEMYTVNLSIVLSHFSKTNWLSVLFLLIYFPLIFPCFYYISPLFLYLNDVLICVLPNYFPFTSVVMSLLTDYPEIQNILRSKCSILSSIV